MKTLTNQEIDALKKFKAQHGRSWKSELAAKWMKGTAGSELQAVRNKIGPSGLMKLKAKDLED